MNVEKYEKTAHRGLHNKRDIPENSMEAFNKAIEKNYAIELDVRMSKDGYLVVFHDENLKRMTGIKEDVSSLNLSEIKKLKLLATESKIPTFEDVLLFIDNRVPIIIEVKTDERYKEILSKLINTLKNYNGEYIVEAFDPRILFWLKKNAPTIIRGQLADKNIREVKSRILKILLGKMVFNIFTKPDFIAYQYTNMNNKFYQKQKKKGIAVAVWTVKSKEEYLKVKDCSDIVIFENEESVL